MSNATRDLEALRLEWQVEREQAALHYELWRLQPEPGLARRHAAAAIELYDKLYRQTGWAGDRRHYEELTGEALPDLPAFPAPPAIATADSVELAALLARVDQIVAELNA
jgi:hypothetical protein